VGHHRFIEPSCCWSNWTPERQAEEERLRVIGNLTRPDGVLAPRSEVERVGIGSVRMVFTDVAPC
jgi:hypothetical protein